MAKQWMAAILCAGIVLCGCQTSGQRNAARSQGADFRTGAPAPRSQTNSATSRKRSYESWQRRVGPAYPGDFWPSWGRDGKEAVEVMADDFVALATDPTSLLTLAAAGTAGILINASEWDEEVEHHYQKNGPQLSTFADEIGDVGGNPATHFALGGIMYLTSLAAEDVETYETSKTLISALAINGMLTQGLKWAARTEAPNGNDDVWPSGHTSSSFTLATVMWHEYGPLLGAPLMAFAGYVGYERIDATNHQFSDVVSGALIGVAVGYAVAENHDMRMGQFSLVPFARPEGGVGLALARQF